MSRTGVALLISLLAVPAKWVQAQQQPNVAPAATQSPATPINNSNRPIATLRTTARLVVLDVVVTDGNGNPVKGLKPSDFTLSEDGVPQKFASFSEHDAPDSSPVASEPSLPPNTFTVQPPLTEEGTKTVIVLDNIHYPNDPMVRGDILSFMKTVAPGNPIAIIRIDWQGLHFVQTFTSDPQLLQDAVASHRMLLPLPDITGRVHYTVVINPYHRLARYLAGIPGRINLAWVTDEGNPDDSRGNDYPDLSSIISNLQGSTDVVRLSRVVPYVIKAGGYIGGMLLPFTDFAPQMPNSLDLDLMPAATGGLLANQAMADLATAAGGHAFFDGTDKAMAQVMALGSNYYTLSYVPTNPNWNDAYRRIAIDVTGIPQTPPSRFGWSDYSQPNVVYRSGYYARTKLDPNSVAGSTVFGMETTASTASSPIAASSPNVPILASSPGVAPIATPLPNVIPRATSAMEAAMGFGTLTPNQVDFTIVVTPSPQVESPKSGILPSKNNFITAPFRDTPYRNYKVHYWIDPKDLKFSRAVNGSFRDDIQFVAIVYSRDGLVANSVSITAHIQVPADTLEFTLASGVTFDQTIAIPITDNRLPDSFFLRVGVSETSTGHIGTLELPADWIKLPPQAPSNNTAANPAPTNLPH
jgi:VWFA-related protein